MELLTSCPVLFVLLLAVALRENWAVEKINYAYTCKRSHIIEMIGGVNSKANVKLLKKIVIDSFEETDVNIFLSILKGEIDPGYIIHWKEIPLSVLKFVAVYDAFKPGELLSNLLRIETSRKVLGQVYWHYYHRYQKIYKVGIALDEARVLDAQLYKCKTVDQYYEIMDKIKLLSVQFSVPPVPGNQNITPIMHSYDLMIEAEIMHHCVASYSHKILEGEYFIYRITLPERATLSLMPHVDHGWDYPVIEQIRGKFNNKVLQTTCDMVSKWLESNIQI